jgi:CSLREA domain-containing protein/uncharacterized repeat protein (TIGR01451 family)
MKKLVIVTHRIVFNAFLLAGLLLVGLLLPAGRALAQPEKLAPLFDTVQTGPTYVVNTVADWNDGVCGTDDCTLREAINAVNAAPDANNTITFNIADGCDAATGVCTIETISDLPAINSSMAVVVDGYTQPGASANTLAVGDNAKILIELNGWISRSNFGIAVQSNNATVRGLVVNYFNYCFYLGSPITGLKVQGNFIGTDPTGENWAGCQYGIYLDNMSGAATIGGTAPADRNIISGNGWDGIYMFSTSNNVIQGNYIGTNAAGTAALVNYGSGISMIFGADNIIGGAATGAGNLISGNSNVGLNIYGASGTQVLGNYIGTNLNGTNVIPNGDYGVYVGYADNVVIGGTAAGAGNLISGNRHDAVFVTFSNYITVQGNTIGTNAAGTAALPNANAAVYLWYSTHATIGGTAAGAGNLFSGNLHGMFIDEGSNDFLVQGNKIGTDVTGTVGVGNMVGLWISRVTSGTIGGTTASARNIISGNYGYGIYNGIFGPSSGIVVQGNYIGTDVTGTVSIPNTPGGINQELGSGNIFGGTEAGAGNLISGNTGNGITLNSSSGNQILGNQIGTNAAGDAPLGNSGSGIAVRNSSDYYSYNTIIGGAAAGARNVISGNGSYGLNLDSAPGTQLLGNYIGTNITGTASVGNGLGGVYISISDNSLIGGNEAGAGNLISGNTGNGITLYYNRGNQILGNQIGTNAAGDAPLGNSGSGIAVTNYSDNTIIGGAAAGARNVISGNGSYGVQLDNSTYEQLLGNYIGTNATGTASVGNGLGGVYISISAHNLIGGDEAGEGNLISGNTGVGIFLHDDYSSQILGNKIGTNAAGDAALGNSSNGIETASGADLIIGSAAGGNLISGNGGDGVHLLDSTRPQLQGNFIGTDITGTARVANGGYGVYEINTPDSVIGGAAAGAGNLISGNNDIGLYFASCAFEVVHNNKIGTTADGTAALGNGSHGIYLPSRCAIGGSAAGEGNLVSGNPGYGIFIRGSANLVQGNFIGTNITGTASVGNGLGGVYISNSNSNLIGGNVAGAGNLISGNTGVGITIDANGSNNEIRGNKIGTNLDGTAALGNTLQGVVVVSGTDNFIGSAGAGNLISGNGQDGVQLQYDSTRTTVQGNTIGTDVTGTARIPNGANGIGVFVRWYSTIGGSLPGQGNLISGNTLNGIYGVNSGYIQVQGNKIGTDINGTTALGNGKDGIAQNFSGGWNIGELYVNLISGNTGAGISLHGSGNNTIVGNKIGTDAAGTIALGNGADGILIDGGGHTVNVIRGNQISNNGSNGVELSGSTLYNPVLNNQISGNGGKGIVVAGSASNNRLEGNLIYNNTALGIDLNDDGVTHNDMGDADTGANGLQNFPLITSTTGGVLTGRLNSVPYNAYHFEFFASATCDPTGYGEGEVFLGSINMVADASGNTSFALGYTPVAGKPHITATVNNMDRDETSEFSPCTPYATTTSVSALPGSSTYGDSVTFTAAVTTNLPAGDNPFGAAIASGSLQFSENAALLSGPAALDGTGQRTFTTSTLAAATHPIKGEFLGSADYQASSSVLNYVVGSKALTVSGITADSKPYDRSTSATIHTGAATLSGVVSPDVVGLDSSAATGAFSTPTAGTGKTVTISGLALTGADKANYTLSASATALADITPLNLTVSGVTADNKAYDRSTNATIHTGAATLGGVVSPDVVGLDASAATGAFSTPAAGTGKTVTISGLALTGADKANYSVGTATALADITALQLTVSGITADNKPYDRSTSATIHTGAAALSGIISPDVVALDSSAATGAFDTWNVGTGKTVTISGLALTGADKANYSLATVTAQANITPLNLTVSGITASNKVYDRATNATIDVSGAAIVAGVVISPDVVGLDSSAATGAFDTWNVGTGKTVTISGLALTGADKANYNLATVTAQADITALKLGVSGITASNKVYDGNTDATIDVSGAAIVAGVVISPDVVGLDASAATGAFDTKEIGTNKTVTISGLALTGADRANYQLDTVTTKADITHTLLMVSGVTAQGKTYDGTTAATLNLGGAQLVGVATGDVVALDSSAASGTFGTPTAGAGKTVTISGFALTGANKDNYTLTQPGAQATINPKGLSLTADNKSKVFGEAIPALTIGYSGFISGDNAANSLTGSANIYTDAVATSPVGGYTIHLEQGGLASVNYSLSYTNGTLTVEQADSSMSLSYSPNPAYFTDSVTITAVVEAVAPGAGDPSGNVTFKDNGSLLGTAALALNSGTGKMEATYTSTTLAEGSHAITADYAGDASFKTSSGALSGAQAVVIVPQADLSLDMQASDNPVAAGAAITVTATVTNSGPSQAANANFSLAIPSGLTYVSNSAGCAYASGTLTCNLGSVASAAKPAVTVTLTVDINASGSYPLAGSVTADTYDPVSNQQQTLTVLVQDSIYLYDQDTDTNLADHWTNAATSTPTCGDPMPFLGEFNNETENLHLSQMPAHSVVTVSFDLYLLRSWDGNMDKNGSGALIGPDVFDLRQTESQNPLLHATFSNWDKLFYRQSFPNSFPGGDYPARTGASKNNSMCYTYGSEPQDSTYHLSYSFVHTGSSLSLDFSALGLQVIADESWGLNHVKVRVGMLNYNTYVPVISK